MSSQPAGLPKLGDHLARLHQRPAEPPAPAEEATRPADVSEVAEPAARTPRRPRLVVDPEVGERTPKVLPGPRLEDAPSMTPVVTAVPVDSSQSDGATVKTSFSIPGRCLERLRHLAHDRHMSQADTLMYELARLEAEAVPEEPMETLVGKFTVSAPARAHETITILPMRLSAKNLAALEELRERLHLPSRSALVAKALTTP
jgi:hypothetical protein